MTQQLNLGIIGSGFMGRTYCECLAKYVTGAGVVVVSGGTRAAQLAQDYGAAHVETLSEVLARSDVDALIITTPEQVHPQQTVDAAQAGKHVLVEKPMAATVAECDRMIQACSSAKVRLMVVHQWRFRGVYLAGEKAIDAGDLGAVRLIRHEGLFPLDAARGQIARKPFYVAPGGGGIYMGWNTHVFDLVHFLAGSAPRTVSARVTTTHAPELGADLVTEADVEFADGAVAHVWSDIEYPVPVTTTQQFRSTVIGARGVLDLAGYSHAELVTAAGPTRLYDEPEFDQRDPMDAIRLRGYARMVQEFVDCMRANREPAVTGAEGRIAVALCVAARESWRQQRPVTVE